MFGLSSISVYAIAALMLFSAGTYSGYKVTHNAWEAAQAQVLIDNQKKYQSALDKINIADTELQQLKAKNEEKSNAIQAQITKVVTRTVYRNVCFDDDGLRLANLALTNQAATVSGPSNVVPKPKPTH